MKSRGLGKGYLSVTKLPLLYMQKAPGLVPGSISG